MQIVDQYRSRVGAQGPSSPARRRGLGTGGGGEMFTTRVGDGCRVVARDERLGSVACEGAEVLEKARLAWAFVVVVDWLESAR